MAIIPIPGNRVSNQLIEQRLLTQLATDNIDLLRIQDQLSSGQRITTPSEDARVSLRAIRVQRLLEQKSQLRLNVSTTQAYLSASDTALTSVSSLITNVRGLAITAADTTTSDIEREAASVEILRAVQRVADIGNRKFRGRFLFSGTETNVQPFNVTGDRVLYHGDDGSLESLADVDLFARSNVTGDEAFGAISHGVRGSIDLNPITTENTRLVDLRNGLGISHFSFIISDGSANQTIDIANAETLGDVARLIEANPPEGRSIAARVTSRGLELSLDDEAGGNLFVYEVAGGSGASQLGILAEVGSGSTLTGEDLAPKLRLTTNLRDILGARSRAVVNVPGDNNDLYLEARERGPQNDNVAVQFVDDDLLQAAPGLFASGERAEFSTTVRSAQASLALSGNDNDLILVSNVAGTSFNNVAIEIDASQTLGSSASADFQSSDRTLTISIDTNGNTTLSNLIGAINAEGTFTAIPDNSDGEGFSPSGTVDAADAGVIFGNTGNSGGAANTIYVYVEAGASRANDVLKALQLSPEINDRFESHIDGKDTVLQVDEGNGVIDLSAFAITSGGAGKDFDQDSGIQIGNGNEVYTVNFQGAVTVEDLLNRINGSQANVIARINESATGIDVQSRLSGTDFFIGENGGTTATELGIRTLTADHLLRELNHGSGVGHVLGHDFSIIRNDGVELKIDVSGASTVEDVVDLINNHSDNQDSTPVTARLALFGNGIEIVDDNPAGDQTLTIKKEQLSTAAWDLGLIPRGQTEAYPAAVPPVAATASISFSPPNNQDNAFVVTANIAGSEFNGVRVEITNSAAIGDQALVTYDPDIKRLIIDVDPNSTTANTVVAAINAEGNFEAKIDASDPGNNGSGLVTDTGIVATTTGGVPSPTATAATALVTLDPPNNKNTAFRVTATDLGTAQNGIDIVFTTGTVSGNTAAVDYDDVVRQLKIDIDLNATTASTIVNAIIAEGTFTAELDEQTDPTNDGTGVVGVLGVVATTSQGTPEVLTGADVAPLETRGIFNALIRLQKGIDNFNIVEIERSIMLLDEAFDQLSFTRADVGAREQSLLAVSHRLEDEDIELRAALSADIDTDFVKTISELTSRQGSLEASLRLIGRSLRLTLLEFL